MPASPCAFSRIKKYTLLIGEKTGYYYHMKQPQAAREEYQKDFLNEDGTIPLDMRAAYIADTINVYLTGTRA